MDAFLAIYKHSFEDPANICLFKAAVETLEKYEKYVQS